MMGNPIFIASLFFKVLAVVFPIAVAGIFVAILISGHITTLDLAGTFITAIIIAYIVHLWIYYGRRSGEED